MGIREIKEIKNLKKFIKKKATSGEQGYDTKFAKGPFDIVTRGMPLQPKDFVEIYLTGSHLGLGEGPVWGGREGRATCCKQSARAAGGVCGRGSKTMLSA